MPIVLDFLIMKRLIRFLLFVDLKAFALDNREYIEIHCKKLL